MPAATQPCPSCGKPVQFDWNVCPHCRADFRAGGAPPPRRSNKLLILIIVGVCCLVLCGPVAIIAAIAIPGLLAAQRAANERNAAATLKTFATAQADFRANDRDENQVSDFWVGDVSRLHYMAPSGAPIRLIEPAAADADAAPLGPTDRAPKAGYWYVAIKLDENGAPYDRGEGRNRAKYAICAYPESKASGRLIFIVNEDNTIWKTIVSGEPRAVEQWPADPAREGWSRMDW